MKTSNYSTVLTVTTDPLSLDTPIIDAMGIITYNSAVINWQEVDNAQGYKIYLENTDDSLVILDDLDVSNVLSYNLTGLYKNTNDEYKVKAYYNLLESSYSITDDFVTNDFVILPPTINADSDLTFDSIRINWTKRSNATSYKLYLENTDTTTVILNGVDIGDIDTYLFDGLDPSSNYLWKIKSYNSDVNENSSYSSNQTFTTKDPIPNTPTMSSSTSVTSNSFLANWSAETYADSYNVYVYTDIDLTSLFVSYTGVLTNSKSITGLDPVTNYYTVVESVNESGVSAKSADILTSTMANLEERLLYMKSVSSVYQIFSSKIDGSDIQQHTSTIGIINDASYLPTGDIVYSKSNGTEYKLFRINKSESYSTEYELLDDNDDSLTLNNYYLASSYSGEYLTYSKEAASSISNLHEYNLNTKVETQLTTGDPPFSYSPQYDRTDENIYFASGTFGTTLYINKYNKSLASETVLSTDTKSIFNTVDNANENLYYAQFSTFPNLIIKKFDLTLNTSSDIVITGNTYFNNLFLDDDNNYLYFANDRSPHSGQTKIYKCDLDGSNQAILLGNADSENYLICDIKKVIP